MVNARKDKERERHGEHSSRITPLGGFGCVGPGRKTKENKRRIWTYMCLEEAERLHSVGNSPRLKPESLIVPRTVNIAH